MTLHTFIEELKRRHVFRVGGVYLVAAWGLIEAVTGVTELFGYGETPGRVVAVLAIGGFPIALMLSWFYDITRQGIVRTADAAEAAVSGAGQRVLSARATGMFGLGMLVALISIAAVSVMNGGIVARETPGAVADVRALAVLPLAAADAETSYADALTEELIRRLSREGQLEVIARTSSFRFRASDEPIPEIARQLRVQALLSGTVRRDGERYVIGIELVDGRTGRVLWSPPSYVVAEADAYQVQERIAHDLVSALQLSGATATAGSGTSNTMAAQLYTRGMDRFNERSDASLRDALGYFTRATEADPEFALAFAGLAMTYAALPGAGEFDVVEAFTKGMTAASTAIALDATLAEAHAAVGQLVQNYDWAPAASLHSYERALQFKPSYATAHQGYAEALMLLGRMEEARSASAEALKLDPLSPAAMNTSAYLQVVSGDYEAALAALLTEVSLFPDFRPGHMNLALTAVLAGRLPEIRRALEKYGSGDPELGALFASVAAGIADASRRGEARRAVLQLEHRIGSPVALWLAALGDRDGALAALQRAWDRHADPNFLSILVHPLLAPLHADARYQAILSELGITLPAQS